MKVTYVLAPFCPGSLLSTPCSLVLFLCPSSVKSFQAVAVWRWELGNNASSPSAQPQPASAGNDDGAAADDDSEDEDEVCGICRAPFDGTCPDCKVPGDDCPLSALFSPPRLVRQELARPCC